MHCTGNTSKQSRLRPRVLHPQALASQSIQSCIPQSIGALHHIYQEPSAHARTRQSCHQSHRRRPPGHLLANHRCPSRRATPVVRRTSCPCGLNSRSRTPMPAPSRSPSHRPDLAASRPRCSSTRPYGWGKHALGAEAQAHACGSRKTSPAPHAASLAQKRGIRNHKRTPFELPEREMLASRLDFL